MPYATSYSKVFFTTRVKYSCEQILLFSEPFRTLETFTDISAILVLSPTLLNIHVSKAGVISFR